MEGGFVVVLAEGDVGGFGGELEGVEFEDEVAEHAAESGSVHAEGSEGVDVGLFVLVFVRFLVVDLFLHLRLYG